MISHIISLSCYMLSICKFIRLPLIKGLIYILIYGFLLKCEGRNIGDDSQDELEHEKIIINDSAENLRTYAAKMKSYMNFSVDPCDDFYEYACGNWKNVIPQRYSPGKRSNTLEIQYKLAAITEQLMTRKQLAEILNVSAELMIAQRFYNTCLTAVVFPLPAADQAYMTLIRSIGGFPAIDRDSWNASEFSWFNMSAHLTNYGADGLINEGHSIRYPFRPIFKLPRLGFDHVVHTDNINNSSSRAYRLNEERMRGYLNSFNLPEDKISIVIDGVFNFWRDALSIENKFQGDASKCHMLSTHYQIPLFGHWRSYYEIAYNDLDFNSGSYLDEYCTFYYTELDKVCAKHQEAVANYLAMQLLYRMDARLKDSKNLKEYCLMTVKLTMSHLFNKIYMEEYFSEETHSEVISMVKELRKVLRLKLENVDWLDAATRREALLKESSIIPVIGSYKDERLTDLLIRQIRNLSVVEDSFPQTMINLRRLATTLQRYNGLHFEELSNNTKASRVLIGMQANAMYSRRENSIFVMAGLLHPPAYHRSWPDSLKFGTLGWFIGHELTHGFDAKGSSSDGDGKLRNWWSRKSRATFVERAQCYVDHYSNYSIPKINRKVNGFVTKNENIADAGGLRQALAAYRNHVEGLQRISAEDDEVPYNDQMPGLDLSPEQLFFLGFAQLWCSHYEEEDYWIQQTDVHTVDKYRVLGTLSNNEDFSKVYNCPLGSAMHPNANTCRLW